MNNLIVGIDVGGTKINGVLWNGRKIVKSKKIVTPSNEEKLIVALRSLAQYLGNNNKMAIGAAGIIAGSMSQFPNIHDLRIDFKKIFPHAKLLVDNDARCFARAEYTLEYPGAKTSFFITIGTGIGRAVGKNNNILKIKKFERPEPWETEYQEIRDRQNTEQLVAYLNQKISRMIKPYQPSIVVIGGGLLRRRSFWMKLKDSAKFPVRESMQKGNAVAIGAALLWKE